ncbi:MAG: hypothetical protein ACQES9_10025 [Myxococcota bacterium]
MNKLSIFTISLLFIINFSCKKKETVEVKSLKTAKYNFFTPPSGNIWFSIENIGDLTIKGSMPEKTVVEINKKASSFSKKRAGNILDAITFNPTKTKENEIKISPDYPELKTGESAETPIKMFIPLNQSFPINVALSGGTLNIMGIKAVSNLLTKGKVDVNIRTYEGKIIARFDRGKVTVGSRLSSGNIKMKSGELELVQKNKELKDDLKIQLNKGTVKLSLSDKLKTNLKFEAPEIINKTGKFKLENGKWGNYNKSIIIKVSKGKIILENRLW